MREEIEKVVLNINSLTEFKIDRIKDLFLIHKMTGQDEFPFNDLEIKDGLKIYFETPPFYTLFILDGIIDRPIYVVINE